jgi:hypothetical protein
MPARVMAYWRPEKFPSASMGPAAESISKRLPNNPRVYTVVCWPPARIS